MKSVFVNTLVPSETVTTQFLVIHKEIRQKKTGEPYLSLILADRTGEIEAKMWDNVAEVMDTFERDDFVKVKGLPQIYQNKPQLTIHKIRRLEDHEVEPGDIFRVPSAIRKRCGRSCAALSSSLGNQHLRRLLEEIFADPYLSRCSARPGRKTIHHACLGGSA